jgi:hypothetical protein
LSEKTAKISVTQQTLRRARETIVRETRTCGELARCATSSLSNHHAGRSPGVDGVAASSGSTPLLVVASGVVSLRFSSIFCSSRPILACNAAFFSASRSSFVRGETGGELSSAARLDSTSPRGDETAPPPVGLTMTERGRVFFGPVDGDGNRPAVTSFGVDVFLRMPLGDSTSAHDMKHKTPNKFHQLLLKAKPNASDDRERSSFYARWSVEALLRQAQAGSR